MCHVWSLLLLGRLGSRLFGRFWRRFLVSSLRRRLFGGRCFLLRRSLLVRRGLLDGRLLRELRLCLGLRLLGFDLLWLGTRHLLLRRFLAVGQDLGDAKQGDLLAMALLAAVILAPLLLEHDDLVAACLLHQFGGN